MLTSLTPYPEYHDKDAGWLGRLPRHWHLRPAFGAFSPVHENNKGMKEKTVLSLSYGRIVIKPVEKLHGLIPASFETYQVVNPGDIIIRPTDFQNDHTSLRIGLVKDRGIITSAYLAFRTNADVSPMYGYQLLNVWDLTKAIYGYGSGLRQNLDFAHFKRMWVAIPPQEEQNSIIAFLDWANGRVDRAIRAKRKVIALLNEQKRAIIDRAVTRGLNPAAGLKPSGIEWLGDIPRHWELRRAKQVCSAIVDCKNRTPEMVPEGQFTVVRTTNIRNGKFGILGSYATDKKNYEIWTQRGAPRVGDVFFTREAPAGEACLVPDMPNLCMGQRMMYFRPNTDVLDAQFLLYSVYGPLVRTYIEHACNGSTVGHLRLGQVSALPLLWCPLPEQKEVVAHINIECAPIERVIDRTRREIALLGEYRTRLTADVVTGRLDVREAAKQLPRDDEAGMSTPFSEDGDLTEELALDTEALAA